MGFLAVRVVGYVVKNEIDMLTIEEVGDEILATSAKKCGTCKRVLMLEDGAALICGLCKAAKKRYLASPKGKVAERRKYLKKAYGITLEQYNEMYEAQGGRCRICLKHESAKNQYGMKQLSVDHDHKTKTYLAVYGDLRVEKVDKEQLPPKPDDGSPK